MGKTTRTTYIAGNWKMHKTIGESKKLAQAIVDGTGSGSTRVMIAPPFTALAAVSEIIGPSRIVLGAQNSASAESGAHTGEVSVTMLSDIGVGTVILGHSERRAIYGETDALINTKVKLALAHHFEVILCVGETLEERERGEAESVVGTQLEAGLRDVDAEALRRLVIAYEPVWAIGTGKTATPKDADDMHAFIRSRTAAAWSDEAAESLIIQYGGSVKPANAAELLAMPNIDGALVGGASLEADSFLAIVHSGS